MERVEVAGCSRVSSRGATASEVAQHGISACMLGMAGAAGQHIPGTHAGSTPAANTTTAANIGSARLILRPCITLPKPRKGPAPSRAPTVYRIRTLATISAIDDRLLTEAQRIGGHRTKKATVTEALEEYIRRRKQAKLLELFGTIEFDPKYAYRKQRRRS